MLATSLMQVESHEPKLLSQQNESASQTWFAHELQYESSAAPEVQTLCAQVKHPALHITFASPTHCESHCPVELQQ